MRSLMSRRSSPPVLRSKTPMSVASSRFMERTGCRPVRMNRGISPCGPGPGQRLGRGPGRAGQGRPARAVSRLAAVGSIVPGRSRDRHSTRRRDPSPTSRDRASVGPQSFRVPPDVNGDRNSGGRGWRDEESASTRGVRSRRRHRPGARGSGWQGPAGRPDGAAPGGARREHRGRSPGAATARAACDPGHPGSTRPGWRPSPVQHASITPAAHSGPRTPIIGPMGLSYSAILRHTPPYSPRATHVRKWGVCPYSAILRHTPHLRHTSRSEEYGRRSVVLGAFGRLALGLPCGPASGAAAAPLRLRRLEPPPMAATRGPPDRDGGRAPSSSASIAPAAHSRGNSGPLLRGAALRSAIAPSLRWTGSRPRVGGSRPVGPRDPAALPGTGASQPPAGDRSRRGRSGPMLLMFLKFLTTIARSMWGAWAPATDSGAVGPPGAGLCKHRRYHASMGGRHPPVARPYLAYLSGRACDKDEAGRQARQRKTFASGA
jgi:hypothetical protein